MADKDKAAGMKSAYELALERLERQGIERPREEALSEEARGTMAEVRRQAEAKLAELEILHRDRLKGVWEPDKRQQEEDDYVRERRRIESDRDEKLEAAAHRRLTLSTACRPRRARSGGRARGSPCRAPRAPPAGGCRSRAGWGRGR